MISIYYGAGHLNTVISQTQQPLDDECHKMTQVYVYTDKYMNSQNASQRLYR